MFDPPKDSRMSKLVQVAMDPEYLNFVCFQKVWKYSFLHLRWANQADTTIGKNQGQGTVR